MICFKVDVLQQLKNAGYSSYRLKKEKLLADSTLQKLRKGQATITIENLSVICDLLQCQPGDLLEWTQDQPSL